MIRRYRSFDLWHRDAAALGLTVVSPRDGVVHLDPESEGWVGETTVATASGNRAQGVWTPTHRPGVPDPEWDGLLADSPEEWLTYALRDEDEAALVQEVLE